MSINNYFQIYYIFFLNVRFTSIRHALALCALRLGSRRPLCLSAACAFINTNSYRSIFILVKILFVSNHLYLWQSTDKYGYGIPYRRSWVLTNYPGPICSHQYPPHASCRRALILRTDSQNCSPSNMKGKKWKREFWGHPAMEKSLLYCFKKHDKEKSKLTFDE